MIYTKKRDRMRFSVSWRLLVTGDAYTLLPLKCFRCLRRTCMLYFTDWKKERTLFSSISVVLIVFFSTFSALQGFLAVAVVDRVRVCLCMWKSVRLFISYQLWCFRVSLFRQSHSTAINPFQIYVHFCYFSVHLLYFYGILFNGLFFYFSCSYFCFFHSPFFSLSLGKMFIDYGL